MKLISRVAVGMPLNLTTISYIWRLFRIYILKPEVLICGTILFIFLVYLQAVDVWSRTLLNRLQYSLGRSTSKVARLQYLEKLSWELKEDGIAVYAVQGRRPKMEDRFVVDEDINKTGISLYAVFDGHGGEFAANYARDKLMKNLSNRLVEIKQLIARGGHKNSSLEQTSSSSGDANKKHDIEKPSSSATSVEKKLSFRKTANSSQTDECMKKGGCVTDPELLNRIESLQKKALTRVPSKTTSPTLPTASASSYVDPNGGIDYGRLISDEVLAADRLLVEAAKKNLDVAGTTALIALIEGTRLIVANVGDSRGVMCDGKGKTIPLSFDHKPQQMREKKRIEEAGGFVAFQGVWRVNGCLATSRSLGDFPLKDRKFVIADPDILTFDLADHKPMFLLLASDGLWDTFSNEEAVSFIKDRLNEPHYGAKSITLQAYYRGSMDNIAVVVINFKEQKWSYISMKKPT